MESFTLGRLAHAIGAAAPPRQARLASGVSTDTRTLKAGEVFFALPGARYDGAGFVRKAFAKGARAAVVQQGFDGAAHDASEPLLAVSDVRRALLDFARSYREELGFVVAAVTGSAGKTTTKDLLWHMIRRSRSAVRAPKSFNNDVGLPLTLLSAGRKTEVVVTEIGSSAPGEIATLGAVARPDLVLITCIGSAHLEGLGGPAGVASEKLSLLEHLRPGGAAVLNGDDLRLRGAASALASVRGPRSVSLCSLDGGPGWTAKVSARAGTWRAQTWAGSCPGPVLELPVPGYAFALDALLALAAAVRLGVHPQDAANALAGFEPRPGRWRRVHARGVTLVDDTYNANPTSVAASLRTFATLALPHRRIVVLGAMKELGPAGPAHHRAVGRSVARLGAQLLVVVGEDAWSIAAGARRAGMRDRVVCVPDAVGVAEVVAPLLTRGDAVLFKASRACRLERAVEATRRRLVTAKTALAA